MGVLLNALILPFSIYCWQKLVNLKALERSLPGKYRGT